eukprot:m.100473 g.100473  ORF g.100473 m.100473 type:complete len:741 (-) comp15128_c0_seq1:96-2318(-)
MFARLKEKIQSGGSAPDAKAESENGQATPSSNTDSPKSSTPAISRQISQDDAARGLGLEAMSRAELETFAAKRHRQWQRGQEKLSDLVIAYKEQQRTNDKLTAELAQEQALSSERVVQLKQSQAQDIESKSNLIQALTTRLEDEKAQSSRLQDQIDTLLEAKAQLAHQESDSTAILSKNKRELSRLSIKVEHLQQDADRAQSQHEVKLKQLKDDLEVLRVANTQLSEAREVDQAALQTSQLEVQQLQSELKQANALAKQLESQPASPAKLASGAASPGIEPPQMWTESRGTQQTLVLESRLAAVNLKLANKESQCATAEQQLNLAQEATKSLESKVVELQQTQQRALQELETQLVDLEHELEEAQAELRSLRHQRSKDAQTIGKLESNYSTLEQDFDQSTRDLEALRGEKRELVQQTRQAQEDQAESAASANALKSQLASTKAQRDQLEADNAETRLNLGELRNQNQELELALKTLEGELTEARQLGTAEEAKVLELNRQIGQLCKDNAELNEQIRQLGGQHEARKEELADTQHSVTDLRAQLAALLDEHQLRCDSESQLQEQVLRQQQQLQLKEAQAEAVESELIACQSQREQDALDNQQQRQALEAITADHATLTQRLEEEESSWQRKEKQQQQHISELKRSLTRSMRGVNTEDKVASSSSSSREQGAPQALALTNMSQGNAEYLRNVIFKFIVAGPTETKHLVKVLTTLLKFTPAQEQDIRKHIAAEESWLVWPFAP